MKAGNVVEMLMQEMSSRTGDVGYLDPRIGKMVSFSLLTKTKPWCWEMVVNETLTHGRNTADEFIQDVLKMNS